MGIMKITPPNTKPIMFREFSNTHINNKKGSGALGKKALLQPDFSRVSKCAFFSAWGVVSPMRPKGAKCGGKKYPSDQPILPVFS